MTVPTVFTPGALSGRLRFTIHFKMTASNAITRRCDLDKVVCYQA